MHSSLFDHGLLSKRASRIAQTFPNSSFLFTHACEAFLERLRLIRRQFKYILVIVDQGREEGLVGALEREYPAALIKVQHAGVSICENDFDLVVCAPVLHWVENLPEFIASCKESLKPDGLFLGSMLGGQTLTELRHSYMNAELSVEGGATPRVIPMLTLHDMAMLLQKIGFGLPVVDRDVLEVSYETPLKLMGDLRGMGEANRLRDRKKTFSRRDTLEKMLEYYKNHFSSHEGRVIATFELFYLTGWAPDESQQKPLVPGSGRTSLKQALGA